jgi:two-component system chemotaxis sensor kinase CheA
VDTSQFLELFITESREHLEHQGALLSQAARQPLATDEINELFRHAHSIKGMAQSMGFRQVAALAHAMEDILHGWRDGGGPPEADLLALLVRANDRLAAQIDALAAKAPEPDAADLVGALRLAAPQDDAAAPASSMPTAEPDRSQAPAADSGPGADQASDGGARLWFEIGLQPTTPLPAARAAVVVGHLKDHGRVLEVSPDPAAQPAGRYPTTFRVGMTSRVPPPRLIALVLNLPEVSSCRALKAASAADGTRGEPEAVMRQEAIGTIRVATERMDHLLDGIGELLLDRERLKRALEPDPGSAPAEFLEALGRTIKALRVEVMTMRLLPFASIAPRLTRTLRDLSERLGKAVELDIRGGDIVLDRSILEDLMEPLQHILRNSIDHGIEARADRLAAGKPPAGMITIELSRRDDRVCLVVADDGRGIDPVALRRVAARRRFLSAEAAERLTDEEALMLITLPGFSTAARTTDISGRGVGMDVVRMRIQKLGGRLTIRSVTGAGTRLEMDLPPAVTVTRAFLCRSAGEIYAVPVAAVQATLEVRRDLLQASQGEQVVRRDDDLVTVLPLAGILAGDPSPLFPPAFPAFLYRLGERAYALGVDEILGEEEIVIKPLRHPLELLPQYAGAAILNDGRIALILDPANLTRSARAA